MERIKPFATPRQVIVFFVTNSRSHSKISLPPKVILFIVVNYAGLLRSNNFGNAAAGAPELKNNNKGHEALNTEKDRARASADVQSSQKTVAQRLPHEEKIPQGNALRSIPFLYLYFLVQQQKNTKRRRCWCCICSTFALQEREIGAARLKPKFGT